MNFLSNFFKWKEKEGKGRKEGKRKEERLIKVENAKMRKYENKGEKGKFFKKKLTKNFLFSKKNWEIVKKEKLKVVYM